RQGELGRGLRLRPRPARLRHGQPLGNGELAGRRRLRLGRHPPPRRGEETTPRLVRLRLAVLRVPHVCSAPCTTPSVSLPRRSSVCARTHQRAARKGVRPVGRRKAGGQWPPCSSKRL